MRSREGAGEEGIEWAGGRVLHSVESPSSNLLRRKPTYLRLGDVFYP
jgi:hypothetical protein